MTIILGWHCATATEYSAAMRSGYLRAAYTHYKMRHPLLWFTTSRQWAPTTLVAGKNGVPRCLSEEEAIASGGLYRFGTPVRHLLAGRDLRAAAKVTTTTWTEIQSAIRAAGGNPESWFGTAQPLSVIDLIIDHWQPETGIWQRVKRLKAVANYGYICTDEAPIPASDGASPPLGDVHADA